MVLPTKVIELAQQAGFVFWGNESWGPGPGHIDWSAEYSREFETFVYLMLAEFSQQPVNHNMTSDEIKQLHRFVKALRNLGTKVDSIDIKFEQDDTFTVVPKVGNVALSDPISIAEL